MLEHFQIRALNVLRAHVIISPNVISTSSSLLVSFPIDKLPTLGEFTTAHPPTYPYAHPMVPHAAPMVYHAFTPPPVTHQGERTKSRKLKKKHKSSGAGVDSSAPPPLRPRTREYVREERGRMGEVRGWEERGGMVAEERWGGPSSPPVRLREEIEGRCMGEGESEKGIVVHRCLILSLSRLLL